ncbi:MAG: hypothetical protein IT327_32720 [Anaerolineae bacterium]|nr:hypothetical protein [Anaerolineae bacterium]
MKNQSHLGFLTGTNLEKFSKFVPMDFIALISTCLCILLNLVACNYRQQDSINPTKDIVTELGDSATFPVSTIESMPEESASLQTGMPDIFPSQTPQLTLEPRSETQSATGRIFVYDSSGIQQVSLLDHAVEYFLIKGAGWIDWGARFAQNRKDVAYWIKNPSGTEVWFSSLTEWQPRRILELDDVEYDFATLLWSVNDRYLLFSLSVWNQSSPLEDTKIIRTYIIDVKSMELVISPFWSGGCSILASSPQTAQLSLWCSKIEQVDNSQEFLVLEPEEIPWITQQEPDSLVENCLVFAICAWSQNGKFVVFVATEDQPNSLYYTLVDNPEPSQLDDKLSYYYRFPSWSPDNRFLYYAGACTEVGECPNVLSLTSNEIVWRAKNNHNRGEYGIISVDHVIWSPDSHYIAMPILIGTDHRVDEQILVLDIFTQQEVLRVLNPNMGDKVLDLVWVDD